jgi:hypothetical protein
MSMIMLSVMDVVPSVVGFPHNGYFPRQLEREPLDRPSDVSTQVLGTSK